MTKEYEEYLEHPEDADDSIRYDARHESIGDSVGIYLREIGSIPLLTAAQEVEIGRAMERGQRAAERLEGTSAMSAEERALAQRDQADAVLARHKLIESNLRLVVSIATRYGNRGLPLSDLIEEGNLGLMRAAEKFDYKRGYRFSTYATWWIRQAVTRGLASQARVVRLPVHVVEMMGPISQATVRLSQELGREPKADEIASQVGLTPERVREVLGAIQQPISLQQPYGAERDGTVADMIEDKTLQPPAERVLQNSLRDQVRAAVASLTDREQRVVALRYGLAGDRQYTLAEIGKQLGLTRERIRQIEREALGKLRQLSSADTLRALV